MKHIFFIILLFIIASGSTNKAHAQFGLFDTVWTINGLAENYSVKLSPNDSLMKIWTWEKPQNVSRYRLYNTYTKELIWDTASFQLGHILSDNKSILSWDSNTVKIRDLFSLEPISSINYVRPNFSNCTQPWGGISEVDTSVYSAGYCGATAIKGISYKVNYKTGQTAITSDSLPYFAMTISEDGQYVAGVYYTGGDAINVPYNEVIEVRKISDYSLVFRESKYYSDYDPNFYPYNWVSHYEFKFSNDNKYLALYMGGTRYNVFNLLTGNLIFEINYSSTNCTISENNKLLFMKYVTNYSDNTKKRPICIYNCENNYYEEMNYIDSSKMLSIVPQDLVFNDKYLLVRGIDQYNPETKNFYKIGDVALLKLNFDLTSIQEPGLKYEGTLYPNPTNMNLTLKLQLQSPIALTTTLHNTEGSLIKDFGLNQCEQGENILYFDVSELLSGIYFLKLSGERFSQIYKVIISR